VKLQQYVRDTAASFEAAGLCFAHGTDNALDESVYLIYGSLGIDYGLSLDAADRELDESEIRLLDERVSRRIRDREPVAYILGEAWFCGLPFFSDRRALIPRSPIAELIMNDFAGLLQGEPRRIMDLCTGSGCIGIACAVHFPAARVDLVDIDDDCLRLASENSDRHGTSDRVQILQSDLFERVSGRYDLIVANPPYVSAAEIEDLPPEFRHEPNLGLLSEEAGLQIPVRIVQQAAQYLERGGLLIMEVGYSAEGLSERLSDVPLLWLDFEQGGEGVMAITREQLEHYREHLN
jgi:ribosomal protein L3 glutamine methyltransferase